MSLLRNFFIIGDIGARSNNPNRYFYILRMLVTRLSSFGRTTSSFSFFRLMSLPISRDIRTIPTAYKSFYSTSI